MYLAPQSEVSFSLSNGKVTTPPSLFNQSFNWHTAESCTKERESCVANTAPDKALSYFFPDKIHMAIHMPQEWITYSPVLETSMKGGERKKTTGHRKERRRKAASAPIPCPSLPCGSWRRSPPSRDYTLKRAKQLKNRLLLLPTGCTALCQLKTFNQSPGIDRFEAKDARQLITSKGTLIVSITSIIIRVITASYQDSISWHQS